MINIPPLNQELVIEINSRLQILNNPTIDDFYKLEVLYQAAELINDKIRSYFSCRPGCSSCCTYDVIITEFEALYIVKKTNIKIAETPWTIDNRFNCPFLKNDTCSVYQYRPFICRTYHVRGNPEYCKLDSREIMEQYGTELGGYGNILFKEMGRFIMTVNQFKKFKRKDIRNFFNGNA